MKPWHHPPAKDGTLKQAESKQDCQSPSPDDPTTIQAAVAKDMIVNIKETVPRIAIINQGKFIFSLIIHTTILHTTITHNTTADK